jgi:hypothetical protein
MQTFLSVVTWCENSNPAKGRVERAHLTLGNRLIKKWRLRGISADAVFFFGALRSFQRVW